MAKHYDNKNQLLEELRRRKHHAECAISSTFSAYMMIGCLVLYEDLGFREQRLTKFIAKFNEKLNQYNDGEISLADIQKRLYDGPGIIVEGPSAPEYTD